MRKKKRKKHTKIITKIVLFSGILIGGGIGIVTIMNCNVPEKRLMEYMKYIEKGEYEQMYAMLDQKKSSMNSKEEFIERNSKIYEGIEMSDLSITDITVKRQENGNAAVSYTTNMQTAAGNVEFTNDAVFSHDWTGYHLIWQDQLIFPELSATDKVQVTSEEAKRGDILDRNGRQLAGEGTASSVGIVPGRMENREDTIKKLAEYLGIGADEIEDKLKAGWVKADSCNGVQREHNKKLNNGLPILHKVPPKRDYGRYFCIMAEKGGTSHGGLTEKLSLFFHAKKQEVNAYGR